uniref:Eukaryotic translation initiation factor 3 30 kDa subunit n=1 Tax=Plectus sambesii TaxID=2011161 RepID=A0A914V7R6_9BILA
MADAWDAEDFDVPEIVYKRPEEIAAEEAAKAAAAAAEAEAKEAHNVKKGIKPKAPKGGKDNHDSGEPQRELTAKEREELQRKTDLGLARELFGGDGDEEAKSLEDLDSEKEFTEFADRLGNKLSSRHKAENYPAFVQHLMYKLCTDMESKNVRKLSTEIKALADLKANEEKTKKVSAKPTIKPAAAKGLKATGGARMYDDYIDGSGGAGGDYNDYDEDFM